jgi:RNA polymerase sigma-70 factor (ECF subfamily)
MPAGKSISAPERELVERAQQGDQAAFASLVSPHRTMLFTVCFRILGDRHAAEDATQTALLAAWQNLGRFQHRSSFSTWLYRIAHNAALGLLRKRTPEPAGDEVERRAGQGASPADVVAEADAVRWALSQIPPDFRTALVLREYAGMSYREIAEAEGIKVETVKTRIARARRAVAALLEIDTGGAR